MVSACILASGQSLSLALPEKDALTRFTYTEYLMGVDARLVVYAPDKQTAETACTAAFARIAELDAMMSDYRKDSELMRLCDKAGGPPVHVSPDMFKVFQCAQEISRRSGGVFDVTVGPIVQLWRKARKTHVLPKRSEIERARKLVGWQKVILDEKAQTVRLTTPGMKLDFGGIAKGYGDDEAQIVLKAHGISRALVDMGGDLVVSGPPPGEKGWKVLVLNAGPENYKYLSNQAISTSGDTEQFVVIGGVQYSHVVDPHTGWALTNRTEATITAPSGLIADPLSLCLTLLDAKQRARLLAAYPGTTSYVRVMKPGEKGD